MSDPIVFIARQKIKPGQLQGYKQNFQEVLSFIEPNKPNTVVFLNYLSEDGTEATLIQIYPSLQAWEQHMQGLGEIARTSYEVMQVTSFEIYGKPNDMVLAMMNNLAQAGAEVKLTPNWNGGFLRLKSA